MTPRRKNVKPNPAKKSHPPGTRKTRTSSRKVPSPDTIIETRELITPSGTKIRILRTNQTDPYDARDERPAGGTSRRK